MKKLSYLFGAVLLTGLSLTTYAQKSDLKVSFGDPFQIPKKSYELGIIGDNKIGYTLVSHTIKKAINLQKFSTDLKLKNTNIVSTAMFPKGYMLEALFPVGPRNYIFYSTWDKAAKIEKLWSVELDPVKDNISSKPVEMTSSNEKLTGYAHFSMGWGGGFVIAGARAINSGKYHFVSSADSTKLMVYYRLNPKQKKDALNKDIIGMYVYDQSLKRIWGNQIEMPYTEKMMDNVDYQVDGKGNVYILTTVRTGEKKDKEEHFEVLMYEKGSTKPIISSFKFKDKIINNIALTEDQTGRMICTGFYSKSGKGTDGAFFLSFDEASKSMKNINKGFYELPTEVIKEFESARAKKKMDKKEAKGDDAEVANLVFRNLRVQDDGTITLYGEQYVMVVYYTYDSKGHATRHETHYFDDIYVMTIAPDGNLKWIKKIPKAQKGGSPVGLGYHLHTEGKNSYMFFVDNAKNLTIKKEEAPAVHVNGAGGVLMCVKLDADGNMTKNNIFDFREEKLKVYVKEFENVTTTQIIGRAMGKGAGKGKGKGSELLRIDVK